MRRKEEKFVSPFGMAAAGRVAAVVRTARLARNMTQEAAAERAKMSAYTWMKIERGDVSVSFGSWLSALECLGLLDSLTVATAAPGTAPIESIRQRARPSKATSDKYDF